MPSIVKKIVFNIALLLLIWGFSDNIASVIEKNFIIDESKALIVSIVSSMLMLLYYIPVLRYEKCFNEKRLLIILNVAIIYCGFTLISNAPGLIYPFPIILLFVIEIVNCMRLEDRYVITLVSFLLLILVLLDVYLITFCIFLLIIFIIQHTTNQPIPLKQISKLFLEQTKGVYSQKDTDKYNRSHTIKATVDNTIDFFANDKSTSLAIIGEWGSGKTAFKYEMQNQIKNNLKEDYIMFDFEAWACDTPQSIVKTFFSQHRKQIGKYIPKLNPIIKDYMFDLLDDFGMPKFKINHISKFIKEIIGIDSDDNFDYITNFLKKAQIRSYIFIDDLDRMQADEIMEVLKLVRNTANFPYTQFVLLYDKDYIVETLSLGKLKNAELYLEKIINVEIPLSKIEYPVLVQSFWDKMENDLKEYNNIILENSDKINNDRTSINDMLAVSLKNEREVLQLCNKMKIMLDFFKDNQIAVSYCDLIWICIINNKYFKLYKKIASNPEILGMSNPFVSGSRSSDKDNTSQQSTEGELSQIAQELYPDDKVIKKLTEYKFSHINEDDNRYRYFSFGYSQMEYTISFIKEQLLKDVDYNIPLYLLDIYFKSKKSLFKYFSIAINELLSDPLEPNFLKLRDNISQSIKDDIDILSNDINSKKLYKELFNEYVEKWDYCTADGNFETLFHRQLCIIKECWYVLESTTKVDFLKNLLINYQKKINDEGFNFKDFEENPELAEQYKFVHGEIYDFLLTTYDCQSIKECIESMDFEHSIMTKEELLTIINGQ